MLIEPKVVTIGQHQYTITLLPATKAIAWRARLLKVIAPIVSVDFAAGEGGETPVELDFKAFAQAFAEDTKLVTDLLKLTKTELPDGQMMELSEGGIDIHFGLNHDQAPLDDAYLLAFEVIKRNHFLPSLVIGALGNLRPQVKA